MRPRVMSILRPLKGLFFPLDITYRTYKLYNYKQRYFLYVRVRIPPTTMLLYARRMYYEPSLSLFSFIIIQTRPVG